MDRIAANRLFLRAVETGSFGRAAAEAGTTQPTVSKQVAALEAHLGVQLLVRSTRALALTEEGARYYEAAREALDALAAAEAAARARARPRAPCARAARSPSARRRWCRGSRGCSTRIPGSRSTS